jgi:hypothetical protein
MHVPSIVISLAGYDGDFKLGGIALEARTDILAIVAVVDVARRDAISFPRRGQ